MNLDAIIRSPHMDLEVTGLEDPFPSPIGLRQRCRHCNWTTAIEYYTDPGPGIVKARAEADATRAVAHLAHAHGIKEES